MSKCNECNFINTGIVVKTIAEILVIYSYQFRLVSCSPDSTGKLIVSTINIRYQCRILLIFIFIQSIQWYMVVYCGLQTHKCLSNVPLLPDGKHLRQLCFSTHLFERYFLSIVQIINSFFSLTTNHSSISDAAIL